jgi:hypothetical protein
LSTASITLAFVDPSLVVLLCVFTLSVVANGALAAYQWHSARQQSNVATQLLSSAIESCRQLEECVRQRSSMADEVAALRGPLTEASVRSALLFEKVDGATKEMAGNLASVPKMIETMTVIAQREVEILEQIKLTAKSLYSALYPKDPKRTTRGPAPEVLDQEYETQQFMQEHNVSRAEAEEMVQHDRMLEGFRVTR